MDNTDKTIHRIKQDLDKVSTELMGLINAYQLQVESPLDVIQTAKNTITNMDDYIRFLELSLQGRLLGEAVDHMTHAPYQKPATH